jgi:2-polyprenyl-6-hydroxyphenyl methylase/3-demethylubiquinone-9 3-methyltransferase
MKTAVSKKPLLVAELCAIIVLVLAPFHAFLTLWVSTFTGHFVELRLWDEALLFGVILPISATYFIRDKGIRKTVSRSWFFRLVGMFCLLTLVLGVYALTQHAVTTKALGYALIINLRFLVWTFCIYVIVSLSDRLQRSWPKLIFIPLILAVVFGLMQFFVLPRDFLEHFGYNAGHVSHVAVVPLNQDSSTIRIQSFLRGANPFGAYLACCIIFIIAAKNRLRPWLTLILIASSSLALFLTFSRSAWIGLIFALLTIGWFRLKRIGRGHYIAIGIALVGFGVLISTNDGGVKNALFHTNDQTTAEITSNEGHASAAKEAFQAFQDKPFIGHGPGTAGAASWYNTGHSIRNTESFFLQLLVEVGIIGFLVFVALLCLLFLNLSKTFEEILPVSIGASLIGLLAINLFSYGWTDDTLAYVWWGVAGIALGSSALQGAKQSIGRSGINVNRWLSRQFDRLLVPARWRVDGMKDYVHEVVPPLVKSGMQVFDIGGGKRPFVGMQMARPSNVSVVGVDIDADELAQAPQGLYDATIVADIASPRGLKAKNRRANLVICAALLEHVNDNHQAMKNITEITKKGGKIALFIPAKYAAFAQLNRILPEKLKRKILFSIFPESAHAQGFPAYYDKCTPSDFIKLCEQNKFRVELVRTYYQSTYFSFFFPAHVLWRIYQLFSYVVLRRDAAESFSIVAVKE